MRLTWAAVNSCVTDMKAMMQPPKDFSANLPIHSVTGEPCNKASLRPARLKHHTDNALGSDKKNGPMITFRSEDRHVRRRSRTGHLPRAAVKYSSASKRGTTPGRCLMRGRVAEQTPTAAYSRNHERVCTWVNPPPPRHTGARGEVRPPNHIHHSLTSRMRYLAGLVPRTGGVMGRRRLMMASTVKMWLRFCWRLYR